MRHLKVKNPTNKTKLASHGLLAPNVLSGSQP